MRRPGLIILVAAIAILLTGRAPSWSEVPKTPVQILLARTESGGEHDARDSDGDILNRDESVDDGTSVSTKPPGERVDRTTDDQDRGNRQPRKGGLSVPEREPSPSAAETGPGQTRPESGNPSRWSEMLKWLPLLLLALTLAVAIFLPIGWLATQVKVLRRAIEVLHTKMKTELATRQQQSPAEQVPPELQARLRQMETDVSQLVSETQKAAQTARLALQDRAAAPQLELLGSGFDQFARMVMEERALAAGGDGARSASRYRESAARELSQFNNAFKQALLGLRTQLEQNGPTKREREVFNTLVSIHGKSKQAASVLQEGEATALGTPRFAAAADGLTFQAWCQQAAADPAVMDRAARDSRGLFACLVDEYSREAARRLLGSLQAGPTSGSTEDATERFRRWMVGELLPLDDYLLALEADLQDAYDVSAALRNTAKNLRTAYDRVLDQLQMNRHPVRVNEDYFDPSRQQITNRIGQDEVVRKIEKHGFSWNGGILRKAEVWVG